MSNQSTLKSQIFLDAIFALIKGLIIGSIIGILFCLIHKSFLVKVHAAEMKTATVTAYSCLGIKTEAQKKMNCPSLRYSPRGRTANGTEPLPYKTMACDRANMGRTFHLEGIGDVKCTDTGGAIKGAGRFDLYVESIDAAKKFGKQKIKYQEVL